MYLMVLLLNANIVQRLIDRLDVEALHAAQVLLDAWQKLACRNETMSSKERTASHVL